MAVLRAVVSDKDGVISELELKRRDRNAPYTWYFGSVALIVTPGATPEDAVRNLRREFPPAAGERAQLISILRQEDGQE